RALLCDQFKRIQESARRSGRAVQRREGTEGLAGSGRSAAVVKHTGLDRKGAEEKSSAFCVVIRTRSLQFPPARLSASARPQPWSARERERRRARNTARKPGS